MTRRNRRRLTLTVPRGQGFRRCSVTLLGPAVNDDTQVRVRLANGQVLVVSREWLR